MNVDNLKTIKTIALCTGLDRDSLGAAVLHNILYRQVTEQHRINFKQCIYTIARHELGWTGWKDGSPWDAITVRDMPASYVHKTQPDIGPVDYSEPEKSSMRKFIEKVIGVFT